MEKIVFLNFSVPSNKPVFTMLINKISVLKLLPAMIMTSRFSIPYLPYLALSLFQLLCKAVTTTLVKSNSVLILVCSYLIIMIPVGSNSPHSPMPENHYLFPQKSSISTSVIRPKDKSQSGDYKKTKNTKFSKKFQCVPIRAYKIFVFYRKN